MLNLRKTNFAQRVTTLSLSLGALLLCPKPGFSHVELLFPDGGDTLEVGSTVQIHWRMLVYHGLANFDLTISYNGQSGPWLPLATDIPLPDTLIGTETFYSWTVPNTISNTVRLRVAQDNFFDSTFTDSSSRDLSILVLDTDSDGIPDFQDNCPFASNPDQLDSDLDGVGDLCDACPGFNDTQDADGDLIPDNCDNCPQTPNPDQSDTNGNGVGDACDICCNTPGDSDNDGATNIADVTFLISRIFSGGAAPVCCGQADANGDQSVNIADVTYLIQRIFSGGPAPICGSGESC